MGNPLLDSAEIMSDYDLDVESKSIIRINIGGSSKGNQNKYYDSVNKCYIKECFYYQGVYWKDYMVEHLSYVISEMLNLEHVTILQQDIVKLSNGKFACRSKDFSNGLEWIPFKRLCNISSISKDYNKSYKIFTDIQQVYKSLKCDYYEEYLIVMIVMDYLLCNEDRHFNNFGLMFDRKLDAYYIAPLFDFGLGLFEHDVRYNNVSLENAVKMIDGKPFNRDLYKPVDMLFNIGLGKQVKDIFKDITIPDKSLFPNELGYEYFCSSIQRLKTLMSEV